MKNTDPGSPGRRNGVSGLIEKALQNIRLMKGLWKENLSVLEPFFLKVRKKVRESLAMRNTANPSKR